MDARQIVSLVPPEALNATAHVIDAEIATRLKRFKKMVDTGTVRTETDLNKISTCPFQMYAQVRPSSIPQFAMDEVEQEMDQPTGISVPQTPPLQLDVVLLSQECGVLLRLHDLSGLKLASILLGVPARLLTLNSDTNAFGGKQPHVRFSPAISPLRY